MLTAVGWQSLQADSSLPFDNKKCIIPTTTGARVDMSKDEGAPLYAAGWIRRGPTGIIGSNIIDSKEAASSILEDYSKKEHHTSNTGYESLKSLVETRGEVVGWSGWLDIDQVEVEEGSKRGKPREKMVSVKQMLEVALV